MSHPGTRITPRMRLWQRLKASGAVVVWHGVSLLPHRETMQQALEEQVQGGQTFRRATALLMMEPVTATNAHVQALLNRSEDSATLLEALAQLRATLTARDEAPTRASPGTPAGSLRRRAADQWYRALLICASHRRMCTGEGRPYPRRCASR